MSNVWAQVHDRLEYVSRPFPQDAVELACEHREEVAPHLVSALEALGRAPAIAGADGYMLHLYAMYLLGYWRDVRGYRPLLALGHLRDHALVDELFDDHMTEAYGRCVAAMSGGDIEPMKALANDEQALVWARSAALDGLAACVAQGDADRDAFIAFLGELGEREAEAIRSQSHENDIGIELLDIIVSRATDLGAVELLPTIRRWFDEDLLDKHFSDLEFIETFIAKPPAECLQSMLDRHHGYIEDPVSEMSWWKAFDEDSDDDDDPFEDDPWDEPHVPYVREAPKIGRNDPCPCGSGKKYKKCHGAG